MRFVALLCVGLLQIVHSQVSDQFCRPPNVRGLSLSPSPESVNGVYNVTDQITFFCLDGSPVSGSRSATCQGRRWTLDFAGFPNCDSPVIPTQTPVPVTIPRPVCPRCPANGVCTLHDGRPACICPPGYFRTERACIARTELAAFQSCTLCNSIPDTTCHIWRDRTVCVCNPTHFRYFQRRASDGGLFFSSSTLVATCVARPVTVTRPDVRCERPALNPNVVILGRTPGRDIWPVGQRIIFACEGEYVIRGGRSAVCTRNGQFSSTPTCVQPPPPRSTQATVTTQQPPSTRNFCISQNIPAAPSNGRIVNVQNRLYSVGETVSYECLPGYVLSGDRTTVCDNGGFRRIVNFCRGAIVRTTLPPIRTTPPPIQTPQPPISTGSCIIPIAPQNGRIVPATRPIWVPGSTVTYSCQPGYTLQGVAFATCTANGRFTSPPPFCAGAPLCEPPVVPFGGTIERPAKSSWNVGDRATYSCNPGFTLVGDRVLTCLASLQYSSDFPQCANNNPTPFVPVQTTPPPPPVTQRPLATCSNPPIPQFAILADLGRLTWRENDVLRFRCLDGYNLVEVAPSVCQSNGLFTDVTSVCIGTRVCREGPIVPPNGFVDTTLTPPFAVGTELSFGCQLGYTLVGATSARCDASGNFRRVISFCTRDQPIVVTPPPQQQCVIAPIPPQNGFLATAASAPFSDGTVITFGCFGGYTLIGDASTTCDNGEFSISFPFCNPSVIVTPAPTSEPFCQRPDPPNFGEIIGANQQIWAIGEAINYNCFAGFVLRPEDETAICGPNGFPPVPVCLVIPGTDGLCTATAPQNGILVSIRTSYSLGEAVMYACAPNFQLTGSASRICQANGQLSGEETICSIPGTCNPRPVPNGALIPSPTGVWLVNEVILHRCLEGYVIAPNSLPTQFCREGGDILGAGPECIADTS